MKKKILISLLCLLFVVLFNFALPRLMPGDTVLMLVGMDEDNVSAEQYEYYRQKTGADRPLLVQFAEYIKGIFTGNLGYSYHHNAEIASLIASRVPATLQIALPAVILSSLISLVLGCVMGMKSGSPAERFTTLIQIIANATPSFLLALLLLALFAFKLRWLPSGALNSIVTPSGFFGALGDRIWHLVLPVMSITIISVPPKYLLMVKTVASQRSEKYVLYARSRGLSDMRIAFTQILPNVLTPFLTMVGVNLGSVLSGSLIVENIFSIKGMGSLLSGAITARDYPLLQGCLLVSALLVVVSTFLTDALNNRLDPLVRHKANET